MERRPHVLDDEYVPLSVAATVAYLHLAEWRLLMEEDTAQLVARAAIALSQIAEIHALDAHETPAAMSSGEVEEKLFRPLRAGRRPDLDRFLIRRGDLRAAIRMLSSSRAGSRHEWEPATPVS